MKKVIKIFVVLVAIVILANILMAVFAFWEANRGLELTNKWCLNSQILNPSNSMQTVILVHGFVGSPFDLKPLAESLAKKDFKIVVPVLPGQLKKSFAYDRAKYSPVFFTNWLAEIIRTETKKNGKKPCLVGFSMGGTLSTVVASQNSIEKLVLIAPFYSLKFADKFVYNSSRILRWIFPLIPKLKKGFINIPVGYKNYECGSYIVSLEGYKCLGKLAEMAKKIAPDISVPVLVVGSRNDEVASFKTTKTIWQLNKNSKIIEFPKSNHIMFYDSNRDGIISNVIAFLTE